MPLHDTVVVCLLAVFGWFSGLLLALRHRWFSRLPQGFMLTLFISLLSVATAGPVMIAVWSYETGKSLLTGEIEQHLSDTAQIITSSLVEFTSTALDQMTNAATMLVSEMSNKHLGSGIRNQLSVVRGLN